MRNSWRFFGHRRASDPLALDDVTAERLVSGAPVDDLAAPYALLASVLDAARQPADAAELADEPVAVAAFVRAAELQPATTQGERFVNTKFALRALVSSVAAVLVLGGVAAAAESDALPAPATTALSHLGISVPNSHANSHATSDANDANEASDNDANEPSDNGTKGPDLAANPHAAFGLCTAYLAHNATHGKSAHTQNPGNWQKSAAFAALQKAANGAIASYCQGVIAAHHAQQGDHGKPSDTGKPTTTGKPSTLGNGNANPHATAGATNGQH